METADEIARLLDRIANSLERIAVRLDSWSQPVVNREGEKSEAVATTTRMGDSVVVVVDGGSSITTYEGSERD